MGKSCCVIDCKNRFNKESDLSFYRLPKAKEKRSKWIAAIRRNNWNPGSETWICSVHFVSGMVNFAITPPAGGLSAEPNPLSLQYFHEVPPEILLRLPKILIQLTDITLVQKCHNIDGPLSLTLKLVSEVFDFFSFYELTYSPIIFDVFTIKYSFCREQYLENTTK